MANIAPSITEYGDHFVATWANVGNTDTPTAYTVEKLVQALSLHVTGTFDSATVVIAQSNVAGTAGPDAVDLGGAAISITAEALTEIRDRAKYLTPEISGGGGSQDITITMIGWF